jgi:hypothetical protein
LVENGFLGLKKPHFSGQTSGLILGLTGDVLSVFVATS